MFMPYFVIGVLILLGVIAMLRAYASANPHTLVTAAMGAAIGSAAMGAVLLLLGLILLGLVFVVVGAALPLALRWGALWPAAGRPRGKTSRIATQYLTMELNHESGVIEGSVLAGRHRDRRLAELTFEQLLEVREDCQVDAESMTLIEAYLDRFQGADWRSRQTGGGSSSGSSARPGAAAMTREEAYEVLGLSPGAGESEIREAHHRLMIKLHPDHGGSDYLAAKINQARDLLLGT
jgi:DnaJ-like protein